MEVFDFKKALLGMFDLTRWGKDAFTIIRMVVILAIVIFTWLGIKQAVVLFKPKPVQAVGQIVTSSGAVESKVDSSVNAKKTQKNALVNFF